MPAGHSDAMVFFGVTGDLAYKKIFPALQQLVQLGKLDMPVIGVARSAWTIEQLQARVRDSLQAHGSFDPAAFSKLSGLLRYVVVDYDNPTTFDRLRAALGGAKSPLHYLAIAPSMFGMVVEQLARAGCTRGARVVIEKPFGRNLASAVELNRTLHAHLDESAIFRIDHYLGKEPVQNLTYFRFANPIVEAGWDARHIDSVQITMAESFGVAGRGKFYEEAGAIRDVVQNHMLQVIAALAMEPPPAKSECLLCNERVDVLTRVRALTAADVVRGQYVGYRDEPGVAADSQVETFAAARFAINIERWLGVPFYVRVGKRLPVTATEVLIRFKRATAVLDGGEQPAPNYYRFRLSPDVLIALGGQVKQPGEQMVGRPIELIANYERPGELDPYARLLSDAARGDATLFARQDGVENSWRVVDGVLGNVTPLFPYEPGTWGPAEAQTFAPSGGWHDPAV